MRSSIFSSIFFRHCVAMPVLLAGMTAVAAYADEVIVRWESATRQAVTLSWQPTQAAIESCLLGGFTYAVRYELKVCNVRFLWADECRAKRIDRRLSQDPISGTVSLTTDALHDREPPTVTEYSSMSGSVSVLRNELFTLELARGERIGKRLKARIGGACRQTGRGFFDRLPSLLSLGILSSAPAPEGNFDSGWTEFSLK